MVVLFEAARHLGWAERVRERREGRIELQYWVLGGDSRGAAREPRGGGGGGGKWT